MGGREECRLSPDTIRPVGHLLGLPLCPPANKGDKMNKFEEQIRKALERRRGIGVASSIELREHNLGEFISAVFSVDNEKDAKEFYDGYVEYLKVELAKKPDPHGMTAEQIARGNVGWCFGEGMQQKKVAMWSKIGASHPVFGVSVPTPTEAVDMGVKKGETMRKAVQHQ